MTTEDALRFLASHQPLPPTSVVTPEVLRHFDEVRRFFAAHPDNRSVPLFLNAFGEGDGHGVYQLVEDTLLAHSEDVVVPSLLEGLRSPHSSVRYWNAQIAANYRRDELVFPLAKLIRRGNFDESAAAVTALQMIGTAEAKRQLQLALESHIENEIKDLIRN